MPDDPRAALARLEPLIGAWTLESPRPALDFELVHRRGKASGT